MPPDLYHIMEKTRLIEFCIKRQQAQIVAASADGEAFGSRHKSHLCPLGAASASSQSFCNSTFSAFFSTDKNKTYVIILRHIMQI